MFAALRRQARQLPPGRDANTRIRLPGTAFDPETATPADFEREAAYQHAVLTAALGEKPVAAKEYLAIVTDFPESEEAVKAIRRLAKLHGGELLPAEQKVWEAAQTTAVRNERERRKARSLCGPEVVAELLRRADTPVPAPVLAKAMGTDEFGTSMKALADALKKRGYRPKGLKLSIPALWNKKLPAIALLKEGHFVLVDRVAGGTVETWDPDVDSFGADGNKTYGWPQFEERWTGMALILE